MILVTLTGKVLSEAKILVEQAKFHTILEA